jgi:hypothetical protein
MTRLTANANAKAALERRKLEKRAEILRARVEAMPGAHQAGPLAKAENYIALRMLNQAQEDMDQIDRKLADYAERLADEEMARAGAEQDRLLAERGVETDKAGKAKTRDGWYWLRTRDPRRLSGQQEATGNRYAVLHATARQDALKVGANDNAGGVELTPEEVRKRAFDKLDAAQTLEAVHHHLDAATGSTRLSSLLQAVCGHSDHLRTLADGDDRRAMVLESELRLALDMAAVAFRTIPKKDAA